MQKKTKIGLLLGMIITALFLLATFPIGIASTEKEIKQTIEDHLDIYLPASSEVVKNKVFEAPIYQIQGVIRSEDVEVLLPKDEYGEIKESLLSQNTWKHHSGGSYSFEVANDREKVYFFFPANSELITYFYTYD